MPLDKLTWLKKKLGFDVDDAKAKKKKVIATPQVVTATASLVSGTTATVVTSGPGPSWQNAQRSPDVTAAPGLRMGANRGSLPPPPLPLPDGGTLRDSSDGYTPVDGLPPGYATLGETEGGTGYTPDLEIGEGGTGYTPDLEVEQENTNYSTDLDLRGGMKAPRNFTPQTTPSKKFDPVDASDTDYAMGVKGATGLKGKSVGDEYLGEHNEAGWREKIWKVNPGDTGITTKLNSEEERSKGTLELQEDGSYKRRDGQDLEPDENIGYAMDPKTGEMATFSETMKLDGKSVALGEGVGGFKKGKGELEVTHHTTALGGDVMLDENNEPMLDMRGRPVMKSRQAASAGFVKFNFAGQMISISNSSGHYKPSVSMLLQAVEHLTKQGAFFEDQITDANGNEVDSDSKPGQLFAAVQAKLKQKAPLLQMAQSKTAEFAEATDEEAQKRLAKAIESLGEQLNSLSAELEGPTRLLGKLGIGPSRRMRQDANVEISEVKAGMGGGDIRSMQTSDMKAEDFLKSGGNPEQLERKETMMEELKEKTAGTKATLDHMADVRSQRLNRATGGGGPSPSEEDIDEALNALKPKATLDDGNVGGEEGTEEQGEQGERMGGSSEGKNYLDTLDDDDQPSGSKASGGKNYLETLDDDDQPIGSNESGGKNYLDTLDDDDQPMESKDSKPTNYFETTGTGYDKSPELKN